MGEFQSGAQPCAPTIPLTKIDTPIEIISLTARLSALYFAPIPQNCSRFVTNAIQPQI
jgi:hypothetical protein